MTRRFSTNILRALVIVSGLALIASSANLMRVEWVADHTAPPSEPSRAADTAALSPAAKLEALQRRLDELKRTSRDEAQTRAARLHATAFLQISSAAMFLSLLAMIYRQRRSAKAGTR